MMPTDNDPLAYQYTKLRKEWADLNAEASKKEHLRTVVRDTILNELYSDLPQGRAESMANAHARYKEHILEMVEARRKADQKEAEYLGCLEHIWNLRSETKI